MVNAINCCDIFPCRIDGEEDALTDIIAIQCIGAKRDRIVKAHGNAKQKNRPYARITGHIRRLATERARKQKNAEKLVQEVVEEAGGDAAAAFERSNAEAVIRKAKVAEGTSGSAHKNMAQQVQDLMSKYYAYMDVPGSKEILSVEIQSATTQAR